MEFIKKIVGFAHPYSPPVHVCNYQLVTFNSCILKKKMSRKFPMKKLTMEQKKTKMIMKCLVIKLFT